MTTMRTTVRATKGQPTKSAIDYAHAQHLHCRDKVGYVSCADAGDEGHSPWPNPACRLCRQYKREWRNR